MAQSITLVTKDGAGLLHRAIMAVRTFDSELDSVFTYSGQPATVTDGPGRVVECMSAVSVAD